MKGRNVEHLTSNITCFREFCLAIRRVNGGLFSVLENGMIVECFKVQSGYLIHVDKSGLTAYTHLLANYTGCIIIITSQYKF